MEELKYRPYKPYLAVGAMLVFIVLGSLWIVILFFLSEPQPWWIAAIFLLLSAVFSIIAYWFFRISKTVIVFNEAGLSVFETRPKGQQAFFQWTDFCCACNMTTPWKKHSYVVLMPQYDIGKAKAYLKKSIFTDGVIVNGIVAIQLNDAGKILHLIQSKLPYRVVKI